jgi:hypothetical protein
MKLKIGIHDIPHVVSFISRWAIFEKGGQAISN